ncbi:MAG: carboxypeptidase regulatory-like domain-containing protein [Planctomycetota bacterium]|nr:MAG: carboxypeptidase regulatory-like domain-containing protein [Planctomycetota bacterium]
MTARAKAALLALPCALAVAGLAVLLLAPDGSGPAAPGHRAGVRVGNDHSGTDAGTTGRSPSAGAGRRPRDASVRPGGTGAPARREVSRPPVPAGGGSPAAAVGGVVPSADGRARVEVRCLDEAGRPLRGVRIEVRRVGGAPLVPAVSGDDGQAVLRGAAVGERIEGVARSPTSSAAVRFGPLEASARTRVNLRFRRAALGLLEGTLYDDGGQPIPAEDDPRLLLINPKSPEGKAELDAVAMNLRPDGTFRAELAQGVWAVSAKARGRSESDRTYVTVSPDAPARANLVLPRAGRLAGTIRVPGFLRAELPRPLEIVAEIRSGSSANPLVRIRRFPIVLDATLRYELAECDAGRWRLRVEDPASGGRLVGPWHTVIVEPGQSIDGYTLSLSEVMVSLRGVVRDDRGLPLEGVEVSCGARRARSDAEGRYELRGLDLGSAWLEATAEGYAPAVREINYRGAALEVDLALPRLGGVRGRVLRDGRPAAGVTVYVCYQEEDGVRPYETRTDEEGRYRLDDLPPATYSLKAGPGADPFALAGAPTVTVTPAQVVEAPPVTAE